MDPGCNVITDTLNRYVAEGRCSQWHQYTVVPLSVTVQTFDGKSYAVFEEIHSNLPV